MKTMQSILLGTLFLGATMMTSSLAQADDKTSLPGYAEGAQVVRVEKTQGMAKMPSTPASSSTNHPMSRRL